jgi:hypothetical protein
LRAFTLALLGKWVWKIKSESAGLWYRALACRYGAGEGGFREGGRDCSIWWHDIRQLEFVDRDLMDEYSVKDTYKSIMSGLPSRSNPAWVRAWHKSIPSKVSCLVWSIFQNRIVTKDNLVRRGVTGQGMSLCVGGCGIEESISHLFFECPVSEFCRFMVSCVLLARDCYIIFSVDVWSYRQIILCFCFCGAVC